MKLLKGVAITGLVLIGATNPLFGPRMLRALIRDYERKHRHATKKSIRYLKDRGYVTMSWMPDGRLKVEMTKQGKKVIEHLSVSELTIAKPAQWDRAWRVVIFDVPNTRSKDRLAFTQHLKNLGFRMAQKSVWVYPYACHREIMILRKFYNIEEYVMYL